MINAEVLDEILMSGADDWAYLGEIEWVVKSVGGVEGHDRVDEESMALVRVLLEEGLMEVGDVTEAQVGFAPWNVPIADAIERTREGWRSRGDDLRPGDVCWFNNTPKGGKRAEELFRERMTRTRDRRRPRNRNPERDTPGLMSDPRRDEPGGSPAAMVAFAAVGVIAFVVTATSLGRTASRGYWLALTGLFAAAFFLGLWGGRLRPDGASRRRDVVVRLVGGSGYAIFLLINSSGDELTAAAAAGLVGFFLGLAGAMHLKKRVATRSRS